MKTIAEYESQNNKNYKSSFAIFVVDDDLSYLYSLSTLLSKNPLYKIYCYKNGEDCIKHMSLNPSVIILDYFLNSQIPKAVNGLDVLKKIKSNTKVIMLSSQKKLDVAIKSLNLGAYTYIIKDINAFSTIINTVNTLCNQQQIIKHKQVSDSNSLMLIST